MASLLLAAFRELQFNNFHWDFFFFYEQFQVDERGKGRRPKVD